MGQLVRGECGRIGRILGRLGAEVCRCLVIALDVVSEDVLCNDGVGYHQKGFRPKAPAEGSGGGEVGGADGEAVG